MTNATRRDCSGLSPAGRAAWSVPHPGGRCSRHHDRRSGREAEDTPRLDLEGRNAAILATLRRHSCGQRCSCAACGSITPPAGVTCDLGRCGAPHLQSHLLSHPVLDHDLRAFSAEPCAASPSSGRTGIPAAVPVSGAEGGATREPRDRMRAFLREHAYRWAT